MGEVESSFGRNPADEDVINVDPRCNKLMDDLFLVVENSDELDQNPSYPMSLRPFPSSFWKHSIGDNRTQSCPKLSIGSTENLHGAFHFTIEPRGTRRMSEQTTSGHPSTRQSYSGLNDVRHNRSISLQHSSLLESVYEGRENTKREERGWLGANTTQTSDDKNLARETTDNFDVGYPFLSNNSRQATVTHSTAKRSYSDPIKVQPHRPVIYQQHHFLSMGSEGEQNMNCRTPSRLDATSAATSDLCQRNPFVPPCHESIGTIKSQIPIQEVMPYAHYRANKPVSLQSETNVGHITDGNYIIAGNQLNSRNQIQKQIEVERGFLGNASSLSQNIPSILMDNTTNNQPSTFSHQPFDTPFLSKLCRDAEIHDEVPCSGITRWRKNSDLSVASSRPSFSSSLPTENTFRHEPSSASCCNSQDRLTSLEMQCNALQQKIRFLRNTQPGLTESQNNLQAILNEVQDSLELSFPDDESTSSNNVISSSQASDGQNVPNQNESFLTVPGASHSVQSSMDSGLGLTEFDLTSLLGTTPFGSTNDLRRSSDANSNQVPTSMEDTSNDKETADTQSITQATPSFNMPE